MSLNPDDLRKEIQLLWIDLEQDMTTLNSIGRLKSSHFFYTPQNIFFNYPELTPTDPVGSFMKTYIWGAKYIYPTEYKVDVIAMKKLRDFSHDVYHNLGRIKKLKESGYLTSEGYQLLASKVDDLNMSIRFATSVNYSEMGLEKVVTDLKGFEDPENIYEMANYTKNHLACILTLAKCYAREMRDQK